MKKIAVYGLGYVGLANTLLLARQHSVVGIDINQSRIEQLKKRVSPLNDEKLASELQDTNAEFSDGSDLDIKGLDYVVIALPTDFLAAKKTFNCASIISVISDLYNKNPSIRFIIKSTVYIGFCDELRRANADIEVFFVPEFLREGCAMYDALNPDRVIVGGGIASQRSSVSQLFALCYDKSPSLMLSMSNLEAEACKLFANTYLAMRVAYFNEIDSFCMDHGLDPSNVLSGMCSDHRIGSHYNNPSFGYGGYCLPKDTLQTQSNFRGTPEKLISAIVHSNRSRKRHIVDILTSQNHESYGVYRLAMKKSSDNCREAAVIDIIQGLVERGKNVVVFEENDVDLKNILPQSVAVTTDLKSFKATVDVIIANRVEEDLLDCMDKVFTRDIYNSD